MSEAFSLEFMVGLSLGGLIWCYLLYRLYKWARSPRREDPEEVDPEYV